MMLLPCDADSWDWVLLCGCCWFCVTFAHEKRQKKPALNSQHWLCGHFLRTHRAPSHLLPPPPIFKECQWDSAPAFGSLVCLLESRIQRVLWVRYLKGQLPLKGQQTLSVKGRIVNILGSVGHVVSVSASQLCYRNSEAATGKAQMKEQGCIAKRLHFRTLTLKFHIIFTFPQMLCLLQLFLSIIQSVKWFICDGPYQTKRCAASGS